MVNVVISSADRIAVATALLLAIRTHRVCLLNSDVPAGDYLVDYFGEPRSARLVEPSELEASTATVAVVFAEGEDVAVGVAEVFRCAAPDLLVIIGGGLAAPVSAVRTARRYGLDGSRILLVGGFPFGGDTTTVNSEKVGIPAGFLAETSSEMQGLATEVFPEAFFTTGVGAVLSNLNALVHVPTMVLNAMSVERGDETRFYVESFGDSVCRLIAEVDTDRIRLGGTLGVELVPIEQVMNEFYGGAGMRGESLREMMNSFPPYQSLVLPTSFEHRFLAHDLRSTLGPMVELARILDVEAAATESVVRIGEILLDAQVLPDSRLVAREFLDLATP